MLLLFVNDDKSQILKGREHCGPCTDDHPHAAASDALPLIVPLAHGQGRVQDGDTVAEIAGKGLQHLRRQRDLRHQKNGGFSLPQDLVDEADIDRRLPTAGNAEQQRSLRLPAVDKRAESLVRPLLVIVQHGGLGTPELMAGAYGNTTNYNDMLQRVTRRGIDAFAPQLLLWSGQYEVPYDRGDFDARLKKLGSSITALEVYGFTRIIDYFEAQSHISTFGMIGLSYGGLYTLFTAAVEPRIKSSIASCFFNTMGCVSHGDLKYFCSFEQFDAEVACLVYPRKLCIELGKKDTIFDYNQGLKLFEKINELSEKVGTDWIRLESFDGEHEFFWEDGYLDRLIKDIL